MSESTDTSPTQADAPPAGSAEPGRRRRIGPPGWTDTLLGGIAPLVTALIVLCLVLAVSTDSFLTTSNLLNVLVQISVVGIAAVGGTFVIITSGIDLSVGSTVALSGMVAAWFMKEHGASGALGIVIALAVGVLVGAFNGMSVTWLRLTPFIATLAMLAMGRGLTQQVSQGQTIFGFPADFTFPGNGKIAGIQAPVIITVIVFAVGWFLLNRTNFGQRVFAVGGNREAARLAGIPVGRVVFTVYALAGLCAGLAGIVLAGRLNSALSSAANGLELQVIAAVVIGGTSLFGGRGSLIGTFIGALLIGVINNGLTLLNVNPFWTQFIQGVVIFVAVLLDALNQRRLKAASS
ncbi:ABC transporter permease [Cryptosporangium sp. NPDC048952]|uniref:ABC transporter permease n=1 Tax=Cryptosporangium sp. NPDC048952 TaxID=3363961 RepID=UPI00371A0493